MKRHVAEGLVVIVSILIAFALDAWWDERQLRQEVREELIAIDQELAENMDRVRYQVNTMTRITDAHALLLEMLHERGTEPTVTVPDTLAWFSYGFISPTFDPSTGAIEAMIASGRLRALRSTALRSLLASVRARAGDVVEDQVIAQTLRDNRLFPLIDPSLERSTLRYVGTGFFDERTPDRPLHGRGNVDVPNTREIRNVIGARAAALSIATGEMRQLLHDLERMRELIALESS